MSSAFPMEEVSGRAVYPRRAMKPRVISPRKLAANRANALKSTGPRTVEGKHRSASNAVKHGLCAAYSHLPQECDATFNLFVDELEAELRPRTILQRTLFPQIVNLTWRLRRLPEAQTRLFAAERETLAAPRADDLPACEVLARCFSRHPQGNAFVLMNRYERSMENALLRLLREFHKIEKAFPGRSYDEMPSRGDGESPPRIDAPSRGDVEPERTRNEPTAVAPDPRNRSENPEVAALEGDSAFPSEPKTGPDVTINTGTRDVLTSGNFIDR